MKISLLSLIVFILMTDNSFAYCPYPSSNDRAAQQRYENCRSSEAEAAINRLRQEAQAREMERQYEALRAESQRRLESMSNQGNRYPTTRDTIR